MRPPAVKDHILHSVNAMSPLRRLTAKAWALALASVLLATLAAEGLYRSGWSAQAEHLYSDLWHRLAGVRQQPEHVALVMIDDATLASHQDEPLAFWTPHFARVIGVLREVGVRVVALDFLFSGSPERWIDKLGLAAQAASRDYDRPFRDEINKGSVLLAAFRVGNGNRLDDFVLPSSDYLLALPELDMLAHVGLANLRADPDAAVRRMRLVEADTAFARAEGLPRLGFALLAALRARDGDPQASAWRFGAHVLNASQSPAITYAGPPGTLRPLSFARLLAPDAARDPAVRALAGKVVVVGAGYAGMNDVHPTPYSTSLGGAQSLMSGPEIHANAIETLLTGRFQQEVAAPTRLAAFLLTFSLLAFVGIRLRGAWSPLLALGLATAWAVAGYALFGQALLFPVAHMQGGLLLVLTGLTLLRLSREERERAKISAIFGHYVSDQVMAALLASPELPELGGRAARMTVLFSDIRNFTTLSERLTAKEVVEILNAYFERVCAVLLQEGATIDKFIGDAVMAEFGVPLAQPDHARRALRAAVQLRAVAETFRAWMAIRFADRDLPDFHIGIGVHSGEAVVGNIGSHVRMEYTAIGDTVNLASRLEGKTKEVGCTILASLDTVREAGAGVKIGDCHHLSVKGRSQPVEACEILDIDSP